MTVTFTDGQVLSLDSFFVTDNSNNVAMFLNESFKTATDAFTDENKTQLMTVDDGDKITKLRGYTQLLSISNEEYNLVRVLMRRKYV